MPWSTNRPESALRKRNAPSRQKLGSKRILLVEDEPINREIAQTLLEDVGFVVDLAEDGGKAIERVQALPMI
ncbi:hypothetical protein [uncultured Desulfovibrio sp.]|uniref:response regulator n=1 Tax=uncultured Desulfovibrio sp. TaxID=167968 RepID=UPI002638DEF1|nr:hypothetical protein [uncultured Desulfovibrio sp.]